MIWATNNATIPKLEIFINPTEKREEDLEEFSNLLVALAPKLWI